jgi:hypothetical protein
LADARELASDTIHVFCSTDEVRQDFLGVPQVGFHMCGFIVSAALHVAASRRGAKQQHKTEHGPWVEDGDDRHHTPAWAWAFATSAFAVVFLSTERAAM